MTSVAKKDVKKFVGKSLEELENKTRDEVEEKARKKDAERQKLQKKVNLPAQLAKANQLNDPEQVRRRYVLLLARHPFSLPSPPFPSSPLHALHRHRIYSGTHSTAIPFVANHSRPHSRAIDTRIRAKQRIMLSRLSGECWTLNAAAPHSGGASNAQRHFI
jgi:hypothetical protein